MIPGFAAHYPGFYPVVRSADCWKDFLRLESSVVLETCENEYRIREGLEGEIDVPTKCDLLPLGRHAQGKGY